MSLSLKITSYQRLTPSQQQEYHAESDSFTIGRSHDNDWAIPDPQRFLSGVHCRISKEGDDYFITDTSTNGVFLNGSEERLTRNDPVKLNPGDRFRIGDYEFEVQIDDDSLAGNPLTSEDATMVGADPFEDPFAASGASSEPDPFAEPDPFDDDPFAEPEKAGSTPDMEDDFLKDVNAPLAPVDDGSLGKPVSIDSLMDFGDDGDSEEEETAEKLEQRQTPLSEAFKPSSHDSAPKPTSDRPAEPFDADDFPDNWDETTGMLKIPEKDDAFDTPDTDDFPDNWDEATGMFVAPEASPAPPEPVTEEPPTAAKPTTPPPPKPASKPAAAPPPVAPVAQGGDAMAAFARGAGLEPGQISAYDPDVLFEQIGRMVIEFTEGLIQTLGGRTHIKSEFRLDQTMIRPAENNPFKFSTSKTRTLLQLLSKKDPAYKSGVNAISEGFDDVNAHQMAVIAGMEAALQSVLHRFNPKSLENRIVSDSIFDNILPGGKKAKYWDIFKLLFDEIAGEAEDDFQQLFGKEFSRAYEEQLDRLKNTRKER
ncbi:MAG: type VI secretion system-associated FHA domain protein TagH [Xanthomonadales bacterium]|nr:type VI secretion system-associated FHA domain protein TagH [Gammaproteobacteria bacterium]MBT8072514.1 type VI secretion system-associated FHA domain protein TagH [Gammaproteobacteria bacterium]NNK03357.1 type VI secretion system-associated FHA domain protein TagH [Xanthomonadales bacterium]NNK99772.1 type VI secretion system-associated FHA domain protein TagH [Xanthomonadales bacterium]